MRFVMMDHEFLKNIADKLKEHGEMELAENIELKLEEAEYDQVSGIKLS